jgi:hypothetical protein
MPPVKRLPTEEILKIPIPSATTPLNYILTKPKEDDNQQLPP